MIGQIDAFRKATGTGILDLGFGIGGSGPEETLASIRRFGSEVLPRIRTL